MAVLTPDATQGQALFEGTQSFYTHDDAADSKDSGGNYSHNAVQGSAHEMEAMCDWARYVNTMLLAGTTSIEVYNATGGPLPAGPVRLCSWDATAGQHCVSLADADANAPANFFLTSTLADATSGIAYTDAELDMDTSTASAVGDPVYLSASGGLTLTAPTGADQTQQTLGWVSVKSVTGKVECRIDGLIKIGSSWIQSKAITYAKIQDVSATDKLLGRSSSGSGVVEEIACTAAGRAILDDATATDQRVTLGLVIGTNVQAYDAELAAIAGLTSAADKVPYFTGSGTASVADFTAAGRALVDDASATAQQATLAASLGVIPAWTKVTKAHTDFQAAATSNSIELYSLPAGGIIHAVKVKHSTAFAGTSITAYTVEVGITGATQKYAPAFNVFQAVAATTMETSSVLGTEDHGSATSIKITAKSTGANLSASTAGSVDVWLLMSVAT